MAFREVLPYLSLEPFRRWWYTRFLVALKESALPAPAGPPDVVYRFSICPPSGRPSVRVERRDSIRMTVSQTEVWRPVESGLAVLGTAHCDRTKDRLAQRRAQTRVLHRKRCRQALASN